MKMSELHKVGSFTAQVVLAQQPVVNKPILQVMFSQLRSKEFTEISSEQFSVKILTKSGRAVKAVAWDHGPLGGVGNACEMIRVASFNIPDADVKSVEIVELVFEGHSHAFRLTGEL